MVQKLWIFLIFTSCFFESRAIDTVTQSTDDVTVPEGMRVTLDCGYETTATPYLFWYIQYPNGSPKYILRREKFGEGDTAPGYRERFNASLDTTAKTVPLIVQNVQLSDSAVYYCALRPNTAGYKIIFGEGTRLIIQTKAPGEPSFYKLGEGNNTVCLATGFNKYKALDKLELFSKYNETGPTRIPNEPFFDKAVILEEDEECPNATDDDDISCRSDFKGLFETDENINFLSLTVLGLRFLFLKSILFNVLMTIRALSR